MLTEIIWQRSISALGNKENERLTEMCWMEYVPCCELLGAVMNHEGLGRPSQLRWNVGGR